PNTHFFALTLATRSVFSAPARVLSPPGPPKPRSRSVQSRTAASCSRPPRVVVTHKKAVHQIRRPLSRFECTHPSSKPLQSWHFPNGSGGRVGADDGTR